jgi:hypothetical protein
LIAETEMTQINPTTTIHNIHRMIFNQDGNPDVPIVFVVSTGGIVFVSQYLLLTSWHTSIVDNSYCFAIFSQIFFSITFLKSSVQI